MIEVLDCPVPASFQDAGRPGYRHLGVPLSGALDIEWLAIANALAGNPPQTVALEMHLIGPRLRVRAPLTIALAGEFSARIEDTAGQSRVAGNWCSHALAADEILVLGSLRSRIGYLAIHGGFDLPTVLGSRSTYARAGLGGIDGRALKAGDCVTVMRSGIHEDGAGAPCVPSPCVTGIPLYVPQGRYPPGRGPVLCMPGIPLRGQATLLSLRLPQPPRLSDGPLRVVPGPQREYFTDAAWGRFISAEFTVSREADRMGLRLDGPRLDHDPAHGADIVSDAVTPGVIQVPGNGRPIILLADCQTVGGYPKIATVIGADLPRLGHAQPGETLRFVEVSIEQALAARRRAATELAECIASIVPGSAGFDLDALYAANLIDGVIDVHQAN
ncbi:MAG: biotin-dependent carboxyltransferase family protein [Rhodocyclaceae bacterium]|nr:biotin-dependent carboxyltransferase family protein [Rhodocyclaceae bacterium]